MARARAEYEIAAKDKSKKAFDSVKKRLGGLTSALGGFRGALAGAVGIGGLGALIKQSLDAGDKVQKLAIQLGASTEFLSEMRHVADLSGVSFQAFSKGLKQMAISLTDAQTGSKRAADAYAALGLSVDRLVQMKPEEQFALIADRLREVGNETQRTALAYAVFGGRGTELLQITQQGSAAIADMREESRKLGLSLTRDQADKMAAANDALTTLSGAFRGFGNALAVEFAEPIAEGAKNIQEVLIPVLSFLGTALKGAVTALGGFGAAVVALLGGRFREAAEIARMSISDLGNTGAGLVKTLGLGGGGAATAGAPTSGSFRLGGAAGGKADIQSAQLDKTNQLLNELVRQGINPAVAGAVAG